LWNALNDDLPAGIVLDDNVLAAVIREVIPVESDPFVLPSPLETCFANVVNFPYLVDAEVDVYSYVKDTFTKVWDVIGAAMATRLTCLYDKVDQTGMTTVKRLRPDVCVYSKAKGALLLKGELKADDNEISVATRELLTKMTGWNPLVMADLPFLPCFAWAGYSFRWAMVRGKRSAANEAEVIQCPSELDLRVPSQRVLLLKQSINVFRILVALDRSASSSPRFPLYEEQKRSKNASVWIQPHRVIKKCLHSAPDPVYAFLGSETGVSGAVRVEKKRTREPHGKTELIITPVCLSEPPKNEAELRSAVNCVLTALVALHGIRYVHRDIRWENVLKSGTNSWLLADFEEAAEAGQPLNPGTRNEAELHLPQEVLRPPHRYTAKSDVWAVGKLMEKWASDTDTNLSVGMKSFMDRLLKEKQADRPTAEVALAQLRRLR
jgi:hypothetical protein